MSFVTMRRYAASNVAFGLQLPGGVGGAGGAEQAGGEPVEPRIERLECAMRDAGAGEFGCERAAWAEGEQRDGVAASGEGAGEEDGLALGTAAAQPVLDEENFHCSTWRARDSRGETTMKDGFFNQVLRWLVLAMGVALAAKIVPGIHCADGTTLLVVVVLLSLFNAFLKPVLVIFTLPLVVLTAGLGLWVINAFLLWFAGWLIGPKFGVDGMWDALLGSLIISLTNMVFTHFFGPKRKGGRRQTAEPPRPTPPPGKGDVIDV